VGGAAGLALGLAGLMAATATANFPSGGFTSIDQRLLDDRWCR
jgi:hypothetical protein